VTAVPEALLLGISTGPLCLGFCAPVLVPLFASDEKRTLGRNAGLMGLFLAGRLAAYAAVGAAAGFVGSLLQGPSMGLFSGIFTLASGAFLLAFGAAKCFPEWKLCRLLDSLKSATTGFALAVGLLTGMSLCPPFVAAIAQAVMTGSPLGSIVYFLFFFIGTSLWIAPLFLSGFLARIAELRIAARICLLLAGGWLIVKSLPELFSRPV
jgi:sulfite exporter TauE/SafE